AHAWWHTTPPHCRDISILCVQRAVALFQDVAPPSHLPAGDLHVELDLQRKSGVGNTSRD
ncbi:MAG: hypothetical protein ACOYOM_13360, partial [Chloroflexota bacterium]